MFDDPVWWANTWPRSTCEAHRIRLAPLISQMCGRKDMKRFALVAIVVVAALANYFPYNSLVS